MKKPETEKEFKERQKHAEPIVNEIMERCMFDIIDFFNEHGWISYSKFNDWMVKKGFDVLELENHNRTDGEVHFRYTHKISGKAFDFNGNYWDGLSFYSIIEWAKFNNFLK